MICVKPPRLSSGKTADARWVTVEFTSTVMPGLNWKFHPLQRTVPVHPGELATATFVATNAGGLAEVGQAVMSVSPGTAARYVRKVECFCFTHQTVKAGVERVLPLTFFVSPDLPGGVRTITVSYVFFPAGKGT